MERSTWLSAARCMTTSGWKRSKADRTASTSQTSPRMNSYRGSSATGARDSRFPAYVSLSKISTQCGVVWISLRTTAEPMNPAPPVMRYRFAVSVIGGQSISYCSHTSPVSMLARLENGNLRSGHEELHPSF